jgi:hypothetical protein
MSKSIFASLLVLILIGGVLSSCKKDKVAEEPPKDEFKGKLQTVVSGEYLNTYFYNKQGLVESMSVAINGTLFTKLAYAYLNGKLDRVDVSNLQSDGKSFKLVLTHQYRYQGNQFTELIGTPVLNEPNTLNAVNGKFTYDASGKLLNYALWNPNEDPKYVQQYPVWHVTFDNKGNIITVVTKTYDKDENLLSTAETKYEYDDKPNPYYQLGEADDVLAYFSMNNCVKITYQFSTGNYVEHYSYEYNAEGKPVKMYKNTSLNSATKLVKAFTYY